MMQLGGSQSNIRSNTWILDSEASRHMVSSKNQLIETNPLDVLTIAILGDGGSLKATHPKKATISPNIRLSDV